MSTASDDDVAPAASPPADDVLTIRETASFLKLSDQHVRRLAEAGDLPGRKLGDRWRFSRRRLLDHLSGDDGPVPSPRRTEPSELRRLNRVEE